jgi:hypothetical protein
MRKVKKKRATIKEEKNITWLSMLTVAIFARSDKINNSQPAVLRLYEVPRKYDFRI